LTATPDVGKLPQTASNLVTGDTIGLRTRRYVRRHWLVVLRPFFRYSYSRHAFVLRGVGSSFGPVLRAERRVNGAGPLNGIDRREIPIF
jgi:hypothetical protein